MAPRLRIRCRFVASIGMLVVLGSSVGCVESHDVEPAGQAGSSSQAGSGGRSGSGGARAGSGGSGGQANPSETVSCGGNECPASQLYMSCCTDDDECGVEFAALGTGCLAMNAPGEADSSCPSQTLIGGFITLEGCCRPDGTCGGLDIYTGLGCTNAASTETVSCDP
jgi:hypothetical protein